MRNTTYKLIGSIYLYCHKAGRSAPAYSRPRNRRTAAPSCGFIYTEKKNFCVAQARLLFNFQEAFYSQEGCLAIECKAHTRRLAIVAAIVQRL